MSQSIFLRIFLFQVKLVFFGEFWKATNHFRSINLDPIAFNLIHDESAKSKLADWNTRFVCFSLFPVSFYALNKSIQFQLDTRTVVRANLLGTLTNASSFRASTSSTRAISSARSATFATSSGECPIRTSLAAQAATTSISSQAAASTSTKRRWAQLSSTSTCTRAACRPSATLGKIASTHQCAWLCPWVRRRVWPIGSTTCSRPASGV